MPQPLPIPFPGVSESPLITELVFPDAAVTVRGEFTLNEFATLTPDNLDFLRLYIKVRGNLKEVERILGLSYPTVRARFDALLRSIGYEPEVADPRDETLRLLERGEITPEEATRRLKSR
ncbi:DUF2089 domain-containing protein [Deinococcus ruber]|uniref:DUF2089 domain-containing protein n=1 Tax=Deinococcus ruber TaxID=1848197 RepID=A0A918FG32_9DEIO|nr:DUF2089 domain-containing protein [Deinococcus ruber]GGR35648.1 hypothetical protein GCM10008957_51880 [Deinococcus ruber]